ncbi:hypothetical protein ACFWPU_19135 [Streptomyces sp. NPDC058471]|uniref:hypothetical protein n=1 Tax=Streptomyces sp. NPDC058471 TaxID=3346516 RepID=UPI00364A7108
MWDCYSKAIEALADTPFIAIEPGQLGSSDLTSWVAFEQQTGHALGFIVDPPHVPAEALLELIGLLERRGLSLDDVTWRPAGGPGLTSP